MNTQHQKTTYSIFFDVKNTTYSVYQGKKYTTYSIFFNAKNTTYSIFSPSFPHNQQHNGYLGHKYQWDAVAELLVQGLVVPAV